MEYLNMNKGLCLIRDIIEKEQAKKVSDERLNGKKLIGNLIFKYIKLNEGYSKKWNERLGDFGQLYNGDKKISDTLYRIGGLGINASDKYFQLIKYTEAHYSKEIMRKSKSKNSNHLEGKFCIIDINGVEKVVFDVFKSGYIYGCVYSLDNGYYNIETNKLYCKSYSSMVTDNYLFLDNKYDSDKSKNGVMKINKLDGSYELFS